jgi:uncharacterized protein (TIGR03435 family)
MGQQQALTGPEAGPRTANRAPSAFDKEAPPSLNRQGKLLFAVAASFGLLYPRLFQAQTLPDAGTPAFDVASVKLNRSFGDTSSTVFARNGAFTARNATLRGVIQEAYDLKDDRLLGGPDWVGSEKYDITAKPESPVSRERALSMLQVLLANRFQLKVHRETRERPVYALTVDKSGAQLKEAVDSNCGAPPSGPPSGPPPRSGYCGGSMVSFGSMTSRKVSTKKFAGTLSEIMGRPVLDMTGLTGVFDIDLRWTPDETQFDGKAKADDSGAPSIFGALQELGLKLEARQGPVEVVVIDHIERPSEN